MFPRNSFRSRSLCLFDSEDSIIAAPWPNNAETELVFKTCKLTVSFIFCQKVSEFAVDAQELPRFFRVLGVSQLTVGSHCCGRRLLGSRSSGPVLAFRQFSLFLEQRVHNWVAQHLTNYVRYVILQCMTINFVTIRRKK